MSDRDRKRSRLEGNIFDAAQFFTAQGEVVFTGADVGNPIEVLDVPELTAEEFTKALTHGTYEVHDLGSATGELYKEDGE